MFTEDIRAGGAILRPSVLGWKLCLSALISFVCARDPRCFSDLITGVGHCRTFSCGLVCLLSFDLIAGLVTWGVGCFQLLLSIRFAFFLFAPTGIVLLSFYMLWALLCDADRACFLSLLDSTADCCFYCVIMKLHLLMLSLFLIQ